MRYEFDSVGNILGTENEQRRGGKTYRTSQSYEYDDLYQLTSGNGTYYNGMYNRTTTYGQTYAYDDIGNMTGKTSVKRVDNITKTDGLTYGYSYVYDSVHPHRIASIGEVKYKYDDNGNILKKYREIQNDAIEATEDVNPGNSDNEAYGYNWDESGSKEQIIEEYTWDDDNRLKRAKVNGRTSYYLYNAGGERTAKKEENGDESLYADKTYQVKVNMSRDCITKHIFVGDTRIASRVTFNDLTHSDNEEIRGVYYYHPDHLGNTTFVSDYRGEEYQHLEYTPYGETWVEENSDSNKFINYKFTGKELDEETGLYYFGARYYDPKTSTWASCDPILGDYLPVAPVSDDAKKHNSKLPGQGGVFNAINLNLYHYAGNNPIKYVDPNGKEVTNNTSLPVIIVPEDSKHDSISLLPGNGEQTKTRIDGVVTPDGIYHKVSGTGLAWDKNIAVTISEVKDKNGNTKYKMTFDTPKDAAENNRLDQEKINDNRTDLSGAYNVEGIQNGDGRVDAKTKARVQKWIRNIINRDTKGLLDKSTNWLDFYKKITKQKNK